MTDKDRFYCDSVAKSISEIIRYSLDDEFRNSSYELFGVSCTNEIEKEISKRLMSILENKPVNIRENPEISNLTIKENNSTTEIEPLPSTSYNENSFRIPSENYNPSSKRLKLNYYSQSDIEITEHKDLIPFSSFSQPVPSTSGFFSDEKTSEDFGDQISQIFNKSLKSNCSKYLKKNFKTKKQ